MRTESAKLIKRFLDQDLKESALKGKRRVEKFIEEQAPRYRPIFNYLEESIDIDPELSDRDLELQLHQSLFAVEQELLEQGHDLLRQSSIDDYEKKIEKYLKKVSVLKQSDLASYVSHRKVTIDIMEQAIQRNSEEKFDKEAAIHNLIMPKGHTSDDLNSEIEHNLWLLDERLVFHHYLGSDKTLKSMPITRSPEFLKPDLLSLRLFFTIYYIQKVSSHHMHH